MSQKRPDEESELLRKLREFEEQRRGGVPRSGRPPRQGTPPNVPPPPQAAPPRTPVQPPRIPPRQASQPSRRPAQTARPETADRQVGVYLPWWGILVLVGIVGALTCGLWVFVFATRSDVAGSGLGGLTPTFVVITNTPTPGQPEPLSPPPGAIPAAATPTPEPSPTPVEVAPSDEITVGSQVTIFGTEGDGVAMRKGPGLTYEMVQQADGTRNVAFDGEVFVVDDGPRENDDFIWWHITDPGNPDRFGWAVQDYMLKVPGSEPGPLQEATPAPSGEPTQVA